MAVFAYTAITTDGTQKRGAVEAYNYYAAVDILHSQGLDLLKLNRLYNLGSAHRYDKLSNWFAVLFNFLDSGIPIDKALHLMLDSLDDLYFYAMTDFVLRNLYKGEALDIIVMHSDSLLPKFAVQCMALTYRVGMHPKLIQGLSQYYSKMHAHNQKCWDSLRYPCLCLLLYGFSFATMLWFYSSYAVSVFWIVGAVLIATYLLIQHTDSCGKWVPVLSTYNYNQELYLIFFGLGIALQNSLAVDTALRTVQSKSNRVLIASVLRSVQSGSSLHEAFERAGVQLQPVFALFEKACNLVGGCQLLSKYYIHKNELILAKLNSYAGPIVLMICTATLASFLYWGVVPAIDDFMIQLYTT